MELFDFGQQMMINIAAKSVMVLGTLGLALQQFDPQVVGKLTLDVALVVAVGVLWRALSAKDKQKDDQLAVKDSQIKQKDDQIVAMVTKVTETMVVVTNSVDKLSSAIDRMQVTFEDLPCSVRNNIEIIHAPKKGGH